MLNKSFITRLKLARKNAQREIDYSKRAAMEGRISEIRCQAEICFRHSYPLGFLCRSLSDFDTIIKYSYSRRTRSLSRVIRAIRRKGRIVVPWDFARWYLSGENDLRKLASKTYNITVLMEIFRENTIKSQRLYADFFRISRNANLNKVEQ